MSQWHNIKGPAILCRMKPRCLLSTVDRLPTIDELQESDTEDGEVYCSSQTLEEYVDSIKELSQPGLYPLHGPLRGHRRWMRRSCPKVKAIAPSLFLNSSRTCAPWIPVDLADVSITLSDQSNCDSLLRFNQNLLDRLVGQAVFAGLVWAKALISRWNRFSTGFTLLSLQRALTSAPCCVTHLRARCNWVQSRS